MNPEIKKEISLIKKKKGRIIGLSLKKDREFVIEKEGKEGLKKIEKEMEKLGYPLKIEEIDNYKWYPVSFDALFLLLSKNIFGWNDEVMREWGRWAAKTHFLARIMAKFFVSKERLAEKAARLWRKYYTQGEMEINFDDKNKTGKAEIRDFLLPRAQSLYLEGYFFQVSSLVIFSPNLKIRQTKQKDKRNHCFKISW
jgi:predicted DNA-binding WGR domain protein